MTVSTSDLDASLSRVQIKLFVDFKMLRSYSNAMGVGNVLRVDFSDNQGSLANYWGYFINLSQVESQLLLLRTPHLDSTHLWPSERFASDSHATHDAL